MNETTEKDSKRILFDNWNDCLSYMKKAVVGLVNGLILVLYAIFAGIATLFNKAFLLIKGFVVKNKVFSISMLCVILFVALVMNYVSFSMKVKTLESQRDSTWYELYKIKQALNGDTIIIGLHPMSTPNDTIVKEQCE